MDKITEKEHSRKRACRDAGGGSSCFGSSEQQDWKPEGRHHQPPPSIHGGSSSTMGAHNNNNNAGDGDQTIHMAQALRLFAPHSDSDVANELDLLDFVDEDEQYEIVRNFAAKHIVPHMTGQSL